MEYHHRVGCSLDHDEINIPPGLSGSEISMEEAPCDECLRWYAHTQACQSDPYKKQGKWGLTKAPTICQICFGENGHRVTCPSRSPIQCQKCGMNESPVHTDRMCLIRQVAKKAQLRKNDVGCEKCGGIANHFYPCPKEVTIQ